MLCYDGSAAQRPDTPARAATQAAKTAGVSARPHLRQSRHSPPQRCCSLHRFPRTALQAHSVHSVANSVMQCGVQ